MKTDNVARKQLEACMMRGLKRLYDERMALPIRPTIWDLSTS